MKEFGCICLYVLLLNSPFQAQWSITPASLPEQGDTAYFKTDRLPQNIELENRGESQHWDFSRLKAPFWNPTTIEKQKNHHPNAPLSDDQMVLKEEDKIQLYLKKGRKGIMVTAKVQKDHFNPDKEIVAKFSESDILRPSRLKYRDHDVHSATSVISYNQENIPMYLINGLTQLPDSMKVYFHQKTTYDVDAYGTLVLPSITEKVLQLKIEKSSWTTYEFYIGGVWVNAISRSILGNKKTNPESLETEYQFISEKYSMPLAIVKLNQKNQVQEVKYQIDLEVEKSAPKLMLGKVITVLPNPTFGETRFEFYNYPEGMYRIEIYNIIGKRMWSQDYWLPASGVFREDFSFLRKGTYLYSIIDPDGNKVSTKRLVIITP